MRLFRKRMKKTFLLSLTCTVLLLYWYLGRQSVDIDITAKTQDEVYPTRRPGSKFRFENPVKLEDEVYPTKPRHGIGASQRPENRADGLQDKVGQEEGKLDSPEMEPAKKPSVVINKTNIHENHSRENDIPKSRSRDFFNPNIPEKYQENKLQRHSKENPAKEKENGDRHPSNHVVKVDVSRIEEEGYPVKKSVQKAQLLTEKQNIYPTKGVSRTGLESRNDTRVTEAVQLQNADIKKEKINPDQGRSKQLFPDRGVSFSKLDGVNVISMTLYGSQLRYTMGAIRNVELAKYNFPGWTVRIYTELPSEHPRWGLVPQTVIDKLRSLGADIHFMEPYEDFVPPMMWRFLVADDMYVTRFVVRDADARLSERDAAAVNAWAASGKPFGCIRDHPSHASYAISGGLWGARPSGLRDILRRSWREMMRGMGKDYLKDMEFLNQVIWPRIQNYAYCTDSVSCDKFPSSYPFPVPRYGYEHVGQVVNENDLGRPIDIRILRDAGENYNCTPHNNNMKLQLR